MSIMLFCAVPLSRALDEGDHYLHGVTNYSQGEYGEAVINFKKTLEPESGRHRQSPWAHLYLGWIYEHEGRIDEAKAEYLIAKSTVIEDASSEQEEALLNKAVRYAQRSLAILDEAGVKPVSGALTYEEAKKLLIQGDGLYRNSQFEDALAVYSRIARGLSGYQIAANDLAALAQLRMARIYRGLAEESERRRNLKESVINTEEAIEEIGKIAYRNAPLLISGDQFREEGRYAEAVDVYENLLMKYPRIEFADEIYYSIAECRYNNNTPPISVISAVEHVISLSAESPSEDRDIARKALRLLMRLLRRHRIADSGSPGDLEAYKVTKEKLSEWLYRYPHIPYIYVCRGIIQEEDSQYRRAMDTYGEFMRHSEKDERKKIEEHIGLIRAFQKVSKYILDRKKKGEAPSVIFAHPAIISTLKDVSRDRLFLSPVKEEALKLLARYHYHKANYSEALNTYDQILAMDPTTGSPGAPQEAGGIQWSPAKFFGLLDEEERLEYIRSRYYQEDYAGAIRILTGIYPEGSRGNPEGSEGIPPISDNLLITLANCYYETGDYKKAIPLYQQLAAVKGHSQNPGEGQAVDTVELRYRLGSCLFRIGESEEALGMMLSLSDEYPAHKFAPHILCEINTHYQNEGLYEKAMQGYREILNAYPESDLVETIEKRMARISLEKEATVLYEKAKARYDEIANMDWHYTNLLLYNEVIEQAGHIIAAYPNTQTAINSQYRIIRCYEQQMDDIERDEAVEAYIQMVLNSPLPAGKVVKTLRQISDKYFEEEKYSRARHIYNVLMNFYPANSAADFIRYKLADCFQKLGKYKEAIDEYNKVIEKHPDSKWIKDSYKHMGDCYALIGDSGKAIQMYQKTFGL